ncbi:hypothetical protein HanHA89_Chr11g0446401 [Helianthus annuus]|nr:hypothetical protein HanHA89_Chr11g0446401 [Helianthus annuus]
MIGKMMLMALTVEQLFSLLTLTYKYDVKDCMKFSCDQLRRGMREDRALRILQLESYLQTEEYVQSLTNYVIEYIGTIQTRPLQVETKGYFISKNRDLERFECSLVGFPLNIIEAIISSDVLEVRTKDVVYIFLCKWTKAKYSQKSKTCSACCCQPTCIASSVPLHDETLNKLSLNSDFDPHVTMPLVMDALFFKSDSSCASTANPKFVEQFYKYRPVKVFKFNLPQHGCIVYLDIPHTGCRSMLPLGDVYSQKIELGQHGIHVFAACQHDPPQKEPSFGLFLDLITNNEISVDFEFDARAKPSGMFKVLHSARSCRLWKGQKHGARNLFDMFWSSFIAEERDYLCGGTLHLRVVNKHDIKIEHQTKHRNNDKKR